MYAKRFPVIPASEESFKTQRNLFLVRITKPEVTRGHDPKQLSLLMQLKPAWQVLKVLGLLPIYLPKQKRARTILNVVLQAAYPAAVNLIVAAVLGWKLFGLRVEFHAGSKSTTRLVYLFIYVVYSIPLALIAPLHWARMGHILRFFKDWEEFQDRFLTVTGTPLQLNMRRLTTIVIPVATIGSAVVCLAFQSDMLSMGFFTHALVYTYAMVQNNLFLAVWVLLCLAHVKAADQLGRKLSEDASAPGAIEKQVVFNYHRCWMRLNKLTSDIGTIFCSVFNVMISMWLTEMLLSAFQVVNIWANSCGNESLLKVSGFALLALGSIQIFCHAASLATEAVSGKFKNNINEIEVDSKEIQMQLESFEISVGVHSADISLGGYINVNRALIVSILSAFATFLVVLFQSVSASNSDVCGNGMMFAPNGTSA